MTFLGVPSLKVVPEQAIQSGVPVQFENPVEPCTTTRRRKRAFTICSYKKDNNPMAVEHLAQALGLVRPTTVTQNKSTTASTANQEKFSLDRSYSK